MFWEYVANIVYACVLYKVSRSYLLLLTIISAAAICLVCYRSGNFNGRLERPTLLGRGRPNPYSFLAGLLIYCSNRIIKNKLGFIGIAILMFLAFIMPFSKWNWLSEPLVVLFYFPLLIVLGAGAI